MVNQINADSGIRRRSQTLRGLGITVRLRSSEGELEQPRGEEP
jgi:hypothetical protein